MTFLRALWRGALEAYGAWRTRRELEGLPDRMLRDVGLNRDQLRDYNFFRR